MNTGFTLLTMESPKEDMLNEREQPMHLYWRIIEELKFIGETWIFSDPSLARNFKKWIHKNSDAIDMLDGVETFNGPPLFVLDGLPYSMN